MIESNAPQAQCSLLFAAGLGDDHDWLGAVQHGSGPGGILASQADVDAAREMSFGVFGGVADVENLGPRVSQVQNLIEFDGMEHLLKIFIE